MKVGQVLQAKSGKFYLKAEKEIVLQPEERLYFDSPQDDINFLVTKGLISEAEGQEKLSKVPEFVKYNVKIANKG